MGRLARFRANPRQQEPGSRQQLPEIGLTVRVSVLLVHESGPPLSIITLKVSNLTQILVGWQKPGQKQTKETIWTHTRPQADPFSLCDPVSHPSAC